MTPELSIESQKNIKEVIERYRNWLLAGVPNPYNNSKWEWIKETNEKIQELKQKLKSKP